MAVLCAIPVADGMRKRRATAHLCIGCSSGSGQSNLKEPEGAGVWCNVNDEQALEGLVDLGCDAYLPNGEGMGRVRSLPTSSTCMN